MLFILKAIPGAVKARGHHSFATEFDLEAEEYVPLPKGDAQEAASGTRRYLARFRCCQCLAECRLWWGGGGKDVMSLMAAMCASKDGITDKLRQKSTRWSPSTLIRRGRTRLRVLFIDEVHMLDMECLPI
jgi:RuvB-like protein 1 (pontin 52)